LVQWDDTPRRDVLDATLTRIRYLYAPMSLYLPDVLQVELAQLIEPAAGSHGQDR
jgi:hypothetical protein